MYQFVASYIKWNYNYFCLPPSWMWAFTFNEIEERDIEVAMQSGQDNILVCTCTRFCLWETGRNACPCRSAQQLSSSTRNRKRKILPKMTRFLSLLYFSQVQKFSYSSKNALYFINYLICFFLKFHHVGLTNNSGLSLYSTDWKSTLKS